jgi:hypothetical protein
MGKVAQPQPNGGRRISSKNLLGIDGSSGGDGVDPRTRPGLASSEIECSDSNSMAHVAIAVYVPVGGRLGDAGGVFGGWCRLRFAAQDEAAAFASLIGGVVNLLPEADKVIDRGDDGYDRHPVDRGDGDEVDADDVASPVPIVPAVGEDGGYDRDDLNDGFEFADLAGFDGEAFGGGDGAQAGDEELAADNEDGDPRLNDAGVVADEDDVAGGDEEFVRQWVEKHAHSGDLVAAAGEIAVEAVGDAGEDEDDAGDDLLLAAAQAGGAVPLPGEDGREDPDEQRNACNAAHRDGVGQIHERVLG